MYQLQIQTSVSMFSMPSEFSFKLLIKMLAQMWPQKEPCPSAGTPPSCAFFSLISILRSRNSVSYKYSCALFWSLSLYLFHMDIESFCQLPC